MVPHKVRAVVDARDRSHQSSPAKGEELTGEPQEAEILLQVQGHRPTLRHLELDLVVPKGNPCDLQLRRGDPHHLPIHLDRRTRGIALQHHPMGTATQRGTEKQPDQIGRHGSGIVARPGSGYAAGMLRILLLSMLALAPMDGHARKDKPSKQDVRKDQKEHADLGKRAGIYWRSVRWSDATAASVFIENPNDQLVFQQWLDDQAKNQKITDAKVLRIEVSKEERKPKDGRIRTAVVTVSIEGFTLPDQVLKQQTLTQGWYRTATGWFVDWKPPPPPRP